MGTVQGRLGLARLRLRPIFPLEFALAPSSGMKSLCGDRHCPRNTVFDSLVQTVGIRLALCLLSLARLSNPLGTPLPGIVLEHYPSPCSGLWVSPLEECGHRF